MKVQFAESASQGAGTASADYSTTNKTLTITVNNAADTTFATIQNALTTTTINGTATHVNFTASGATTGTKFQYLADSPSGDVAATASKGYIRLASGGVIQLTAKTAGTSGNIHIELNTIAAGTTNATTVLGVNNSPTLVVNSTDGDTAANIATAITNDTNYTAAVLQTGAYADATDASTAASYSNDFTHTTGANDLNLTLTALAPGTQGTGITTSVQFAAGSAGPSVTYDSSSGGVTVTVGADWTGSIDDLTNAISNATGATLVASSTNVDTTATIKSFGIAPVTDTGTTSNDTETLTSESTTVGGAAALKGVTTTYNTGGNRFGRRCFLHANRQCWFAQV